jgi:hypothetical protein
MCDSVRWCIIYGKSPKYVNAVSIVADDDDDDYDD